MEEQSLSSYPKLSPKTDFETFIDKYLEQLDLVIKKFDDLKQTAHNHHFKCNVAKTAGTAMSGTGVAMIVGSVLLAPVTSGSSLAIGAGGAVMSVTGGISNVITDYVDYKTSNMIMEDIQAIIKGKEEFDKSLRAQLDNFSKIVDKLMETGVDRDVAIITTIEGIATGCVDLTQEPNMKLLTTLSTLIKLHHIESAALETLPIIGQTLHISEKSFQFIYNILGLTGKTAPHIIKTIGRISGAVSIAFTVADVAILIKDWSSDHPSIKNIEEVEKKLDDEKTILKDLLVVVEASRDRESILYRVVEKIEIIEDEEDLLKDFVIVEENDADFEERKSQQEICVI